ncbi:hypothetical protein ACROYT_G002706 [Oculina patagonica]
MRCPKCKNTPSGEKHAFCFICGTKLEANEETRSPPVDDNNTPATNAKDLTSTAQNSHVDNDTGVSLDEGQRKRKVEEQEEKPAKRKSVECEDIPVPGEAADVTASALQNLTIVRDADEKQKAVPVTTTEPPSSITALDCSPEKASDYSVQQPTATGDVIQKVDDACRESSVPKIGNTCESMSLVKAADSSDLPDVPMETEHKNGNKEDANVNLSEECKSDSALQQPGDDGQPKKEEDDNPDSDENGTDVETAMMRLSLIKLTPRILQESYRIVSFSI